MLGAVLLALLLFALAAAGAWALLYINARVDAVAAQLAGLAATSQSFAADVDKKFGFYAQDGIGAVQIGGTATSPVVTVNGIAGAQLNLGKAAIDYDAQSGATTLGSGGPATLTLGQSSIAVGGASSITVGDYTVTPNTAGFNVCRITDGKCLQTTIA